MRRKGPELARADPPPAGRQRRNPCAAVLRLASRSEETGRTGDSDRMSYKPEEECVSEYLAGVDSIRKVGLVDTSYDPRRRLCVDLAKREERGAFFGEFSKGGMPVYMVGVTNNRGDFCGETEHTYVSLCAGGNTVTPGQWTAPDGAIYRDVILIVSGISENEALSYKRQYGQLSVMEVKHGSSRYV